MQLDAERRARGDRAHGRRAARPRPSRRPRGASTSSSTSPWPTPRACTWSSAATTRAACRSSCSAAPGRCTARVARALGAPTLIAPFGAGVMSSVGFLVAPLAFDFVRSWPAALDDARLERAEGLFAEMEREGVDVLASSGVAADEITHERERRHALRRPGPRDPVAWPTRGVTHADGRAAFEAEYERLYGRLGPARRARDRSPGACSQRARARPSRSRSSRCGRSAPGAEGRAPGLLPELGGLTATPVYDRYRLAPGAPLEGPAIVEERESTLVIRPGGDGVVDDRWYRPRGDGGVMDVLASRCSGTACCRSSTSSR